MKRVALILQDKHNECGLACLAMVASSHGQRWTLAQLRSLFAGFSRGLTLQDLARFAQRIGFHSRGVKAEMHQLTQLQKPAVLHWQMNHFVVLVAVKRKGCVIHDPAKGRVFCLWSEVDEKFTGVVLELWPAACTDVSAARVASAEVSRKAKKPALLIRLARGQHNQFFVVALLSLLLQLMLLAAPWHVQWTVDKALMNGDPHLVGVLAIGFCMLLICRVTTHYLRGLLVLRLGHVLSYRLGCALLRHLLDLPIAWFHQRHVGDVMSRFASLQVVREFVTQGAAALLVDVLVVLLSFSLMLVYAPGLAGFVLAVHICFVAVQCFVIPRLQRLNHCLVTAQAAEQSHLMESVRAIENIKVYGCEPHRMNHWQALHDQTLAQSIRLQNTHLVFSSIHMGVAGIELIALIYWVAQDVLAGMFTVGMMFALLSYRGYFTDRLRSLAEQLNNLSALRVHLQRVGELWHEPAESQQQPQLNFQSSLAPLKLVDVGYRHNESAPWLFRELNLCVPAGEFLAIVGASGEGKTTLLKLLMGLVGPSQGSVYWGQRLLDGTSQRELRAATGCVLQADSFFSGSLLENIVLFDVPDLQRVADCIEQVGMSQTVDALPMGLYSHVSDAGAGLSSGQMQRLLLARALYKQPSYLFLDEGTANLDTRSSAAITALLKKMTACTRVVVTHDLTVAQAADRVMLLEQGRLKEVSITEMSTEAKTLAALSAT